MEPETSEGNAPPPRPVNAPPPPSAPINWMQYGSSPQPAPKRNTAWVWVLVLAGIFVVVAVLVGIGSMAYKSFAVNGQTATQMVDELHYQMTNKNWDVIYADAAPRYREAMTAEKSRALFSGIDRKLGAPVSTKQLGIYMNTDMTGQYIRATFETKFAEDATATETVSWKKVDGTYRMQGYTINSDALISR